MKPVGRRPATPGATRSGGGGRRRTGAVAAAGVTAVRGMSKQSVIMLLLLVAVGTVLFPLVRATVQQNARISAREQDIDRRERSVKELEDQNARWQDPAYVTAQARDRLNYVMPGEVGYVVIDTPRTEADESDPSAAAARNAEGGTGSWFGTLWSSTQEAGRAPADPIGSGVSP